MLQTILKHMLRKCSVKKRGNMEGIDIGEEDYF